MAWEQLSDVPLVVAQIASPDVFMELWNLTKGGVPLIVMILLAALYWLNAERKNEIAQKLQSQKEREALYERYISLAQDTNSALRDIRDLFSGLVQPGRRNDRRSE